ncbi:serine hydrolase domain-containing protein [Actinophytocola sp.]|uniref:serine hydrolase domain-containing protein n=1 Tax=Actinophytocola sp. TaxID=1872138 RepID=UPI0038999FFE
MRVRGTPPTVAVPVTALVSVLAVLSVLVAACAPAPSAGRRLPDPVVESLVDYIDQAVGDQRFRGSVEVRDGAKVLLRRGFGRANPATGVRNGPNTRFRIASVSKQFTALAVLVLQEQGRLAVTDAVCAYLPNCPPQWAPITIDQLLTHTAGIHDYGTALGDPAAADRFFASIGTRQPSPEQLTQLFAGLPLDFPPGTRWAYSNSGYVLLGMLVERVSGKSYGTFLHDEILDPLGMSDTGYQAGLPTGDDAVGYTDWTTPAPQFDDSVYFSAGGLHSTVRDLGRWQQFLLNGDPTVVRDDTLADLQRPRVAAAPNIWYGYGVESRGQSMSAIESYGHSGQIPGFNSYEEIRPASGVTVTVLANMNLTVQKVDDLGRHLADMVPGQR